MWQPVTNPTLAPRGRSSSSRIQLETMSSITAAAGDIDVEARVLIPRRRHPIGGDRHRHGAAGDEAEVARTGAGDDAGIGVGRQVLQDRDRIRAGSRQRSAERRLQRICASPCRRHDATPPHRGTSPRSRALFQEPLDASCLSSEALRERRLPRLPTSGEGSPGAAAHCSHSIAVLVANTALGSSPSASPSPS